MHSRIFGIVTTEFHDANYTKLQYALDYTGIDLPFADYTDTDTDVDQDVQWFAEFLRDRADGFFDVNEKEGTFIFHEGFKEAFFKQPWKELVEALLKEDSFKAFCGLKGSFNAFPFDIKQMVEDTMGFHVADHTGSCETLDSFVRNLEYEKEYIVFDTVDYHI